ncbi:MAG: DUF4199 domain-containing protein [Rikenellaceae bacterium]
MGREYFNSAAKWGLFLGVILSLSRIYESSVMISGDMVKFAVLTAEWFAVLLLYVYIVYRANKMRAAEFDLSQGYSFRSALNYTMLISAFSGVIVGITSHIYVVNVIGGYDVYALKSVESIMKVMSEANVEDGVREMYNTGLESVKTIGENPPTIFSTVLSMVANYIISGFAIGLLMGFITKRAPIISNSNTIEEDE